MAESRFISGAQRLLCLMDNQFLDFQPSERASLLAVALGLRIGAAVFPGSPNQSLVQTGLVLGAAAAHAQREMTAEVKQSCEGRA